MNGQDVFWIVVATIVAGVLKWAENRWPGSPPRKRRRHRPEPLEEED